MALTGYAIGGIVMIVIGIILLIAGVILLAIDQSNQTVSQWWVWALIVIGIIALLVGIALFFIPEPKTGMEAYMTARTTAVDPCNPCPQPCPPPCPPRYVELQPACPQPCPQPCPPNPCKPTCTLDLIHKDPCKQAAFHAQAGLPAPRRAGGPGLMPPPPVVTAPLPRPSVAEVEALRRPRRLPTAPRAGRSRVGRLPTTPRVGRSRVGRLMRQPSRGVTARPRRVRAGPV